MKYQESYYFNRTPRLEYFFVSAMMLFCLLSSSARQIKTADGNPIIKNKYTGDTGAFEYINGTRKYKGILNEVAGISNTNHQTIIDFKGRSYFMYHN